VVAEDVPTGNAMDGLVRKCQTESRILIVDDAHDFLILGSGGGLIAWTKHVSHKTNFNSVLIGDGSLKVPESVNTLLYDPVPPNLGVKALQGVAKREGCVLTYFDALNLAKESGGDMRKAFVNAEFMYRSRPKLKKKKGRCKKLGEPSAVGFVQKITLPNPQTASVQILEGGTSTSKKRACTAAAESGIAYSVKMCDSMHERYISCAKDEAASSQFADALSLCGVMSYDPLEDMEEDGVRSEIIASVLCGSSSVLTKRQTEKWSQPKKRKFNDLHYK
jgi:hypothetical protein